MDADALVAAVAGYAPRVHAAALATGPAHHVASPLGAWIVLALAADALEGEAREAAAGHLGAPVDEAVGAAVALLDEPHPAVAAAVACWSNGAALGERLGSWVGRLPAEVEAGPVPTQVVADRWAAARTAGLVDRFPVAVDPVTVLVLASALATKVTWAQPFAVAEAAELGGPWADEVGRVLTRTGATHLADTEAAGRVVVTMAESLTDLAVLTVTAAPEVPPVEVIAAAHELAALPAPSAARLSLFDVPLGPGHSWDLVEEVEARATTAERVEEDTVVLPAWTATSDHRLLTDDRFGFTAVVAHLLAALPPHPDGWEADAAQAAVARYGRLGFEAAAVTALGMRAGSARPPEPHPVPVRTLHARFGHPHAVVAVATQRRWDRVPAWFGPWDRLPVFSAWVAEPAEVTD
ncbi:MAG TPA: hypothetical protein VF228_01745 [Iamia sp.]